MGNHWCGPFDSRQDLDVLVEDWTAWARQDLEERLASEPDPDVRDLIRAAAPSLERRFRAELHDTLDRIWAAHARREGKLS